MNRRTLLLLCTALLLTACGGRQYPGAIPAAERLCADHRGASWDVRGTHYLGNETNSYSLTVVCVDGTSLSQDFPNGSPP